MEVHALAVEMRSVNVLRIPEDKDHKACESSSFIHPNQFCLFSLQISVSNTLFASSHSCSLYSVSSDSFLDMQAQQRSTSAKSFEATIDKIEEILIKLCENVINRARAPDLSSDHADLLSGTPGKVCLLSFTKSPLSLSCEKMPHFSSIFDIHPHLFSSRHRHSDSDCDYDSPAKERIG
jgi:hypothetical protein